MVFSLRASTGGALLGCLGMAVAFVGGLYLLPKSVRQLSHSDDRQIKARFIPIGVVATLCPLSLYFWKADRCVHGCCCCCSTCAAITCFLLHLVNLFFFFLLNFSQHRRGIISAPTLLSLVGIRSNGFFAGLVIPFSMFVVLFAGPLVDLSIRYFRKRQAASRGWFLEDFFPNLPETPLQKTRQILVAPIAEELVFRCCIGTLLLGSGMSFSRIIWISPLFFGVAHLHHFWGMVTNDHVPVKRAALISLVQFTYTTFFGALEMFFFLRTRHLVSVSVAHAWCNLLGLPSVAFLDPRDENYEHRVVIGAAFLLGLSAFCVALYPCTNPSWYGNHLG